MKNILFAYILALFALLSGTALAVELQKKVLVQYPNETPDWVVDKAKDAILQAGGIITHEFKLIKGFSATAGEKVLEAVQAMGSQYPALVLDDEIVTA